MSDLSSSAVQSAPASAPVPAPAATARVIAFPKVSAPASSTPSSSATSASARPRPPALRLFPYTLATPNPWYITKQELSTLSPSTADGISHDDQTLLRAETADFISQMGQHCKITQLAIATGSVYLHVFFTRFSFARFDRFEIAATCLFLAGKVEERRTRVDQVINAYYHVRLNPPAATASSTSSSAPSLSSAIHLLPPSPTSPEYEALRNRIYNLEFVVLDAIEFQFELTHPYTNLMVFLRETILGAKYANKPEKLIHNETSEKGGLAQIAWLFINDSLRSTLCLLYPPDVICVGVIALSLKYKEMDEPVRFGVPVTAQTKPWHEELFGVDRQTIEHISDVILTCVELRYKPDPAQAQALLAEKVTPPMDSTLPVTSLQSITAAAVHTAPQPAGPSSSRPVISIPMPSTSAASSSAARPRQSGGAAGRPTGRPGDTQSRGPQRPHDSAAMSDVIERIVPISMQQQQQQQQPAQSRNAAASQQSASNASQPQKSAATAARPQQQKKGYVWKPPAKSRRPAAVSTTDTDAQSSKPAAPTRPASPSTPPSPFLSHMSPSSRPPSPFAQSLSPMSASKRKDSSASTANQSRKRPHSPAVATTATLESTRVLARNDSNGQSEQLLVEQLGQKLRVVSAAAGSDMDGQGELGDRRTSSATGEERKAEAEQHDAGAEDEDSGRVLLPLDELHALKGGASAKRDELAMMHDVDKYRAELAEGDENSQPGMEHADGASVDDIRAWKRARHEEPDSPASPDHHAAASMATPWEREMDGDGVEEAEPESEFDHSQPSSPAALDESEHRLDQFATVKLQSGYNARHERQLDGDGGEHVDGMDDTLSAYPSKLGREPTDAMAEHSLLTT